MSWRQFKSPALVSKNEDDGHGYLNLKSAVNSGWRALEWDSYWAIPHPPMVILVPGRTHGASHLRLVLRLFEVPKLILMDKSDTPYVLLHLISWAVTGPHDVINM